MRRYKYLIFLVLAGVVFTGCTGGGGGGTFTGHIIGEVYSSSTNAPIPGALVKIAGREAVTNDVGRFEIRNIAAGTHDIAISHSYFREFRTRVTIPRDGIAYHTGQDAFPMTPTSPPSVGAVHGEVLFADTRSPVHNAMVTVAGKTAYTDRSGEFRFEGVPAGSYQLGVSHSEFKQPFERSITIQADRTLQLYGANAIVVERWQPPVQTGEVEGYVYVRSGSQMSGMSLEESEPLFSAQATPPSGFEPVTNATVRIGGRTSYTNLEGMFHVMGLDPGTYTLTVTSPSLRFTIERPNVRVYAGQKTILSGSGALYGGIGYYLAIGISDYPGELRIPGSVQNAERVYDSLFDNNLLAGFGELLTNRSATKSGIKAAIDRAIREAQSEDDYLVIYFSGLSGKDYLSPSDDPGGDWSKVITDTELEGWVRGFPGSVTLIIDGSESSTMADGDPFQPFAFRKPEYTVITAAGPKQGVFYEPSLGSSVFTHFLIKGISGWYPPADANRDGEVTAWELFQYIEVQMDNYFRGDPDQHYPVYYGPDYRNSVIFRY